MVTAGRKLARHFRQMAMKHAVHIRYISDPLKAGANRKRIVEVAPVVDDATYAIAMHELGHCVHPDGFLRERGLRPTASILRSEHAAWSWAQEHALAWTAVMSRVRDLTLEDYDWNVFLEEVCS